MPYQKNIALSIPGLERATIKTGHPSELNIETTLKRLKPPFDIPLAEDELITIIEIAISRRRKRIVTSLVDLVDKLQDSVKFILEKQSCTMCRDRKVTIENLLPFPSQSKIIPIRFFLHLLIHLSLKRLYWTRQEFCKEDFEERVIWKDKKEKRELLVIFNCPIDHKKIKDRLEEAYQLVKPYILENLGGA